MQYILLSPMRRKGYCHARPGGKEDHGAYGMRLTWYAGARLPSNDALSESRSFRRRLDLVQVDDKFLRGHPYLE